MQITLEFTTLAGPHPELLVIPVFEEDRDFEAAASDPALQARLRAVRESGDFKAGVGELLWLYPEQPGQATFVLAGLGKQAPDPLRKGFQAGFAIGKRLGARSRGVVSLLLPAVALAHAGYLRNLTEGIITAGRGAGLYKKERERFALSELRLMVAPHGGLNQASLEAELHGAQVTAAALNWARELVNLAPRDKTPRRLAELIHDVLAPLGVSVEIWDEERIERERMGGLLGVSAGSDSPPRMVLLEWKGDPEAPALALVGKGVTFDSGGLSLKPSASMEDMKCDMSGAAVVAASFRAVATLGLPVHWRGYLPLTENMTGGNALKLGDVLTIRNGLTVEILNTDAEGRLILADALSYAVEQKPAAIIDLATLTGACLVALGTKTAGLFANEQALKSRVQHASEQTGERVWELPLDEDIADSLKSPFADCKNIGGKWGGAILAAKFLEKFVDGLPWVHLDIAGPSWSEADSGTQDAGGTGYFVRSLVRLAQSESTA